MDLQDELSQLIQQVGTKEDNERIINSINNEIKDIISQFKQLEERINSLQRRKNECNNNISSINLLEEKIQSSKIISDNGDITDEQLAQILTDMFNKYQEKSDDNNINAMNQIRLMIIEKYILNSMYFSENEKLSELSFLAFDDELLSQDEIQQYKRDLSSDFNQIGFLRQFVSCRFAFEKFNSLNDSSIGGLYFSDEDTIKKSIIDIIERDPARFVYAENEIGFQVASNSDDYQSNFLMNKSVAEKLYRDIILPYYKEIGVPFSYDENNVPVVDYPDKNNVQINYENVFNFNDVTTLKGIYNSFITEYLNALFAKYEKVMTGSSNEQIWDYIEKNVLDRFYLTQHGYRENSYNDLKNNTDYSNNLSSQYIVIYGDEELDNIKTIINQNEFGDGAHRNQI